MRLHSLTVQAFGPFAERQVVDFDSLNGAGVFLLAGPTGAGKTSVLDAICFALYGVVPGEREVRSLRSDHARHDLAPMVELELTLAERRLRLQRWPEWQRPKKRGEGTTREHAGARLLEVDPDGTERLVSSRVQEVGHELGPLLGMTAAQFQQVVLLPQGGFQTFLRATSDERRTVLEKLFGTQRFTRIESWVHDHAATLRRQAHDARAQVDAVVATISHLADEEAPDPLEPEGLLRWRDELLASTGTDADAAAAREATARDAEAEARELHRTATQACAAARRRDQAQAELAALDLAESEESDSADRLAAHRRACVAAPSLTALTEAVDDLASAGAQADTAMAQLGRPVDLAGCDDLVKRLQQRVAELRALRDVVATLDHSRARMSGLQSELDGLDRRLAELDRASAALPSRREEVSDQLSRATTEADRLAERARLLEEADEPLAAATALPEAEVAVAELTRVALGAHERANTARQAHLDLVEERLRGMAGELAGQLSEGLPCQVCGSTDHPQPAGHSDDHVTEEQQRSAAADADAAAREHHETQQRLAAAEQRVAVLRAGARGSDAATARAARDQAQVDLQRSEDAQREAARLREELAEIGRASAEVGSQRETVTASREEVGNALAAVRDHVDRTAQQVAESLGAGTSLDAAMSAAEAELRQVQALGEGLRELAAAERRHCSCLRRADEAVAAAGFADPDAVASALLTDDEVDRLEALLASRREVRARAVGVLNEPEVQALAAIDPTTYDADAVAAARGAAEDAAEALHTAVSDRREAIRLHEALEALGRRLESVVDVWGPLREQHEVADSMSHLVRGTGGDNQLQMRLSSYVLATRLDQVLAAANERLHQMRDRRYTLHRAARGRQGRGRSGLDLEVLDDWTGETRSPSTLSGGETFKISLALALGLADVITHEAGGLRIDTLFVDEGFGMLDADTLDEVMDCIDELRSGGRSVGVVSHVAELRARIGTQLQVTSSPEGSRLRLADAPA